MDVNNDNNVEVNALTLTLEASIGSALEKIKTLTQSLRSLQSVINNDISAGLSKMAKNLSNFSKEIDKIDVKKLSKFADTLEKIYKFSKIKINIDNDSERGEKKPKYKSRTEKETIEVDDNKNLQVNKGIFQNDKSFDSDFFKDFSESIKNKFSENKPNWDFCGEAKNDNIDNESSSKKKEYATDSSNRNGWFNDIKKTFGKIKKDYKSIGDKFKTILYPSKNASFGQTISSIFLRTLIYGAVRILLNGIKKAIKDGIKDFYAYSKKINGSFSKSLDHLTSGWGKFKATMVLMLQPAIEVFSNIIGALFTEFAKIYNVLAVYNAKLNNQSKVTIVNTEAVKELEKTNSKLLSIDQLNTIDTQEDFFKEIELSNDGESSVTSIKTSKTIIDLIRILPALIRILKKSYNIDDEGNINGGGGIKHTLDSIQEAVEAFTNKFTNFNKFELTDIFDFTTKIAISSLFDFDHKIKLEDLYGNEELTKQNEELLARNDTLLGQLEQARNELVELQTNYTIAINELQEAKKTIEEFNTTTNNVIADAISNYDSEWKTKYDSLLTKYDSLLDDNNILKEELYIIDKENESNKIWGIIATISASILLIISILLAFKSFNFKGLGAKIGSLFKMRAKVANDEYTPDNKGSAVSLADRGVLLPKISIFDETGNAVRDANNAIEESQSTLDEIGENVDVFSEFFNSLKEGGDLSSTWDSIQELIDNLGYTDETNTFLDAIMGNLTPDEYKALGKEIGGYLIEGITESIKIAFSTLPSILVGLIKGILPELPQLIVTLISGTLEAVAQLLKESPSLAFDLIINTILASIDLVKYGFDIATSMVKGVNDFFTGDSINNTIQSIKSCFNNIGKNAGDSFKNGFDSFGTFFKNLGVIVCNSIIEGLNKLGNITLPTIDMGVLGKYGGQTVKLFSLSKIPAYSSGGFVEDGLFFANHGELVGNFGNGKTAVANNEQIIQGISAGVYNAVVSALGQSGGNGNIELKVYLDGKQLRTSMEQSKFDSGYHIANGGIVL